MKDIPGYEGLYAATTDGKVWSTRSRKYLANTLHHTGYLIVCLSKNKGKKNLTVHKIVALTYLGESNLIINHKNGNKTDNNVSNLEYCTHKQNNHHARAIGLTKTRYGEDCGNSKFSKEEIVHIRHLFFNEGMQQFEIANKFNTTKSNIYRILSREVWRHLNDGFPPHVGALGNNQKTYKNRIQIC